MTDLKRVKTGEAHEAFKRDVVDLLKKHGEPGLSVEELVAMMAHMLGQAVAQLDSRKFTPEEASALVRSNIEAGNRSVLNSLANFKGTKQ